MSTGRPGLLSVARRELDWIWHDRVALFLVIGVPLLAFAILSLTFSNAVIRELRVDVVDQDQSRTSMTYVQALNAAPGVNVTRRSTDLHAAMKAVRSGEAIATVYLPRGLERDMVAGKRPQIVIFHIDLGGYDANWPQCDDISAWRDFRRRLCQLAGH